MNLTISVSALVHPTELEEKVRTAVTNIILTEPVLRDFGIPQLYGEGDIESLGKFRKLLREQSILDTARHILLSGIDDIESNSTQFRLNKQVAYIGKVNFPAGDEALGSLYVEISAGSAADLMNIIDWLAPETEDGKPVREIEL